MTIKDMKQIVNLLDNEWDLGKTPSSTKGKICAWIYLFEILEETEYLLIEKDNKKIIGICGYANYSSNRYLIKKNFYKFLKNTLIYSPFIKNRRGLLKYQNNYEYTPNHLKEYFDGEISILIVDSKYRGKKIGEKILNEVFEKAKSDKMKNIKILTDESCNYNFYESCGCKKIYETVISNGELDKCGNKDYEVGYIFEKILTQK